MRILLGANQEHLGHVSLGLTVVTGLLSGVRVIDRDGEPIHWGLRRDGDGVGTVAGGEDCGIEVLGGHLGWGGASAPADRIHSPEESPPSGVGLRAVCHPGHRDGISAGGG